MPRTNNLEISIVMPTYNRGWCLERAIDSVLNQEFDSWELIIVDGGSDDNTHEILEMYEDHSQFNIIYEGEKNGYEAALNTGIEQAEADYITYLDSDDEFKPTALRTISEDIQDLTDRNERIMIYRTEDENGTVAGSEIEDGDTITYSEFVGGKWIDGECVPVIDAELHKNIKYQDKSGGLPAIFWHNIIKNGSEVYYRSDSIAIYHTEHTDRMTGGGEIVSRSQNMPDLYDQFLSRFEQDYLSKNREKLAYFYIEKGLFEIIDGRINQGRESILTVVRLNKRKVPISALILLFSVLPNDSFVKLAKFGHRFKFLLR